MGSLYRIHHASIIDPFRRIHSDYNLLVWSGLVVRFLLGLLPPEHPEAALFDLAVSTLSRTEQSDVPPDLLWCQFAIEALGLVGYRVALTGCIRCKSEIGKGKMAYRSSDGTILCMRCFGHGEGSQWIMTTGAVLDWMSGEKAIAAGNGPIPPDDLREAGKEFLDGVIREHLPRWIPVGELDFLRN